MMYSLSMEHMKRFTIFTDILWQKPHMRDLRKMMVENVRLYLPGLHMPEARNTAVAGPETIHSIWAHIALSLEQVCNLSVSGLAMCGSDIGGFGSDTTPELLVRFYEGAVFVPFFRNHSAMGTRRQEPWQFDETTIDAVRKTVKLRYRFIPYIYDLANMSVKRQEHLSCARSYTNILQISM